MNLKTADAVGLLWLGLLGIVTFLTFGYDKWRAGKSGERVSEARLIWLSALGGWFGGLLGMIVFRHKTRKWTFKIKFAMALGPVGAGVFIWIYWR